ncbi:conserved hypothetical protein [Oleispira antarctica RB-8]|jgi:uncharacterized protein (DUF488 family)|uniref:DUF488 domain-containing protein n=1 Tax=Oleispira antarctica RB-8 TaxID=698738 RepID=R4YUH0_OLEAN|nr:conserved hypothetical protein [Oleispira antarctica RB-8]|tara:strand:+ start:314 stop:754 length:441 start_codon:yes stop_codon:yes gene_type:complete
MKTYTIGFTQKSAKTFFEHIIDADIKTVIDVRLNNVSQLSGFAKKNDLKYFLETLCDADYLHIPDFAPTKEMLNAYKKKEITWHSYEDKFINLISRRNVERIIKPELIENSCFLCSEHEPHFCHRRLLVNYLNEQLNLNLDIRHLF